MSNLDIQELLAAGVHFGHQTQKWNPKMRPYVHDERNGIYIIDLIKTIELARKAREFLKKTVVSGKPVLFIGTKRQASDIIRETAEKCAAFYVTHRWLGGMLTNFKTISLSVDKLRKVERMKENGDFKLLTKKEQAKVDKNVAKLERNLGGIKNMRKLPGAVIVVDPNVERTAIQEANVLKIPVIALTDTNCDPTGIDYVVPGNDDAVRSISIFSDYFADAILETRANPKEESDRKEKEKEEGVKKKGEEKIEVPRDVALEKEILSQYKPQNN